MAFYEAPITGDSQPCAIPNREAAAPGGHQVTMRGTAGVEFDIDPAQLSKVGGLQCARDSHVIFPVGPQQSRAALNEEIGFRLDRSHMLRALSGGVRIALPPGF